MFARALFAQDVQKEKIAAPVQGSQLTAQEDSLKTFFSSEQKRAYLPFGTSTTGSMANDITVINPEEILRYDNTATVSDLIAGRVPGLYGGLNLRGMGDALVLIDGVPRSMSLVKISEVESISVLKDANAAMLYGVQSKNGVILIKTKRGQTNKKRISTLIETGINAPISFPKYLGSADYMGLYNEALANDGLAPLYTQEMIDNTKSGANPYKYPDANYYNSTFLKSYKPASRIETEFSGGNENGQFYANIGWERTGSLLNIGEAPSNNKLNLRTNLDFKINKYISSHVDIVTIFNINKNPQGNFFSDVTSLKPNYYPPLIDTSLISDKKLKKTAKVVNGKYILGGTSQYRNNIYGNFLLSGYNRQFNTSGMFNAGLDFDLSFLLKGLTLKTNASFDFDSRYDETQNNTYAVYEPKWLTGVNNSDSLVVTKIGLDKFSGTQGLANTSMLRSYAYFGVLDYSRQVGNVHSFSASIVAYADKTNQTGVFQSDKHSHLGGRIYYVNNNKYIMDFTSALVSSPKLSPSNRVAFSPSLSLGWILSEEDFLKNSSLINYLKLSASAGIINSDMSLTKYYTYDDIWREYDVYTQGDGNRTAATTNLNNAANSHLFYEKRKEYNVGLEAALWPTPMSRAELPPRVYARQTRESERLRF
jgi:TonB-dependent SusC/RagA subfamily outer membrane receptor